MNTQTENSPLGTSGRGGGIAPRPALRSSTWRSRLHSPFDVPIAILLALTVVSLTVTAYPAATVNKAVGLVVGILTFVLTNACVESEARLQHVIGLFLLAATGVAGLGLVSTRWMDKIPVITELTRRLSLAMAWAGTSPGIHPNELAGVLLWAIPMQWLLLVWLLRTPKRSGWVRAGLGVSALLTTAVLLLTQSRGAWLGLGLGVVITWAWVDRRVRAPLLLGGAAVILIGLTSGRLSLQNALLADAAIEIVGELNWGFRVQLWRVALWGIEDFWLTGMGLGTFRYLARELYPVSIRPGFDFAHAHNGFLQAGVDLGLGGMAAYAALWVIALRRIDAMRSRATGWLKALSVGLAGCIISSLVYNLLDTVALGARPGFMFWWLLALTVAGERVAMRQQASGGPQAIRKGNELAILAGPARFGFRGGECDGAS